jgi:DNA-binding response OmpR family regulator
MKILIVDDDQHILDAVKVGIEFQWQEAMVLTGLDGEAGLRLFHEHDPDVVILDVMMPLMSGFAVLEAIRQVSDVPVIMLSARGEETDQVHGLELGADEYVVKPFSHLALMARIKAVLRRAELPPPARRLPDFAAGELAIDFQDQRVTLGGDEVKLTPVEYRLLYHLARNAGHILPHRLLLDRVWGDSDQATANYLKVFVSRLRAKLEPPGGRRYIETSRGLGYRFVRPQTT